MLPKGKSEVGTKVLQLCLQSSSVEIMITRTDNILSEYIHLPTDCIQILYELKAGTLLVNNSSGGGQSAFAQNRGSTGSALMRIDIAK